MKCFTYVHANLDPLEEEQKVTEVILLAWGHTAKWRSQEPSGFYQALLPSRLHLCRGAAPGVLLAETGVFGPLTGSGGCDPAVQQEGGSRL